MTKQTSYHEHMDELHVSEQKKKETLRLMLQENQRLREKDSRRQTSVSTRKRVWIPSAALAAVACLVLFITGFSGKNTYSFESITLRDLPQIGARGEAAETVSFSDAFHSKPEEMFSAEQINEEKTAVLLINGETHYRGSLQMVTAGKNLSASVTDYEPPILTVLTKTQEINKTKVFLASDQETGRKCCVYVRRDIYIVLYSDTLTETSFIEGIRAVMRE